MRTPTLVLLATAAAFQAPPHSHRAHDASRSRRHAVVDPAAISDLTSVPSLLIADPSLLLADLPTLVAPRDSDLSQVFASPFFIAFFILSITGGLPFLAWLRLSSLAAEDPDAPADLSDFVPDPVRDLSETLPTLPGLPGLPKIPGFGAAEIRDVELPGAVADVTGAKNTGGLIDKLPWNRDDYPLKARKGPGL
mmetsp:Transcript_15148/g.45352  ORF Transcript_15148/g.45352 Transcript_15148/m.45352 type:complete len:194 (+) Transcript_15148:99-680(+)